MADQSSSHYSQYWPQDPDYSTREGGQQDPAQETAEQTAWRVFCAQQKATEQQASKTVAGGQEQASDVGGGPWDDYQGQMVLGSAGRTRVPLPGNGSGEVRRHIERTTWDGGHTPGGIASTSYRPPNHVPNGLSGRGQYHRQVKGISDYLGQSTQGRSGNNDDDNGHRHRGTQETGHQQGRRDYTDTVYQAGYDQSGDGSIRRYSYPSGGHQGYQGGH
ncbi:uncharacterized protein I303_103982 [Kwoniella dejecticola CBS 10117]|uniref:Uncharacterized protein n=1 Tax=Kwoniella dejecticola CBS 10117 TaxID=1296121 RepID=A0A1A6A896_9TREE|nr:uncharacterized protein I303_03999 [Kwoniella dejecticola CBS 10117]OBR86277.1 hypothetical protein I303_03999 [Kwoniella dejecticola CBS 10117]